MELKLIYQTMFDEPSHRRLVQGIGPWAIAYFYTLDFVKILLDPRELTEDWMFFCTDVVQS